MNDMQSVSQQLSMLLKKNGVSSFDELSANIIQTHQVAQTGAIRAINQAMTLRNWLIGCYIVEYEQKGKTGQHTATGC